LALQFLAGVLTIAHTRIRPEPPPADRARPLSGLRHRDSSSPRPTAPRASAQRGWVSSGEQGWVNSAKRLSLAPRVGRGRQQTQPVNRRNRRVRKRKLGVRAKPWGLIAHSHKAASPTGEVGRAKYL
jgi:hypothetical protein